MTGALHDPRVAALALLDRLMRQGRALYHGGTQNTRSTQSQSFSAGSASSAPARPKLASEPASEGSWDMDVRIWQRDCAAAVNELSGGSKAHWLSRAYSQALLVPPTRGDASVEATPAQIVERVLHVLARARESIAAADTAQPVDAPQPHRFDFVHDAALRPVLEQAFVDAGRALDAGDYETSLKTTSGILEAILTDALQARLKPGTTDIPTSSFDERIAAAETAGFIRGGCARLPAAARAYRDPGGDAPIRERDARIARQVLAVVMRDLDPGR